MKKIVILASCISIFSSFVYAGAQRETLRNALIRYTKNSRPGTIHGKVYNFYHLDSGVGLTQEEVLGKIEGSSGVVTRKGCDFETTIYNTSTPQNGSDVLNKLKQIDLGGGLTEFILRRNFLDPGSLQYIALRTPSSGGELGCYFFGVHVYLKDNDGSIYLLRAIFDRNNEKTSYDVAP